VNGSRVRVWGTARVDWLVTLPAGCDADSAVAIITAELHRTSARFGDADVGGSVGIVLDVDDEDVEVRRVEP